MSDARRDREIQSTQTPYEPPKVVDLGTVLEITKRGGSATNENQAGSPAV
jgi:hypothetical protein